MMNKKGVMWTYLLAMILGVVLIVMMVWVLYMGNRTNWKFIQDLPVNYTDKDRLIELSAEELEALNCKRVGKIGGGGYLIIGDSKSNIYLGESGKLWLDHDKGLFSFIGEDEEIGKVENGVMSFDKVWLQDLRNLREEDEPTEGIPSEKEFDLLNGASMPVGNVICRSADEIIEIEKLECTESCSLYEGRCFSESYRAGEKSYGRLDCKSDEKCFVNFIGTPQKLVDDVLTMNDFRYVGEDEISFLGDTERIDLKRGFKGKLVFSVINSDVEGSQKFCVIVRSDKEIFVKQAYEGDGIVNKDILWTPISEGALELVAWIPFENKKIYKRILVGLSGVEPGYRDSNLLTYENFLKSVKTADIGTKYVIVSLDKINVDGILFKEFLFIRGRERVSVWVRVDSKSKWKRLDCYSDVFQIGGFWDEMNIEFGELKSNLKDTLKGCDIV